MRPPVGSGRSRDRGLTPVVGKALEAALVVLYVGLVAAALYGTVVPEYRAAAGEAVGDRTLAGAATTVEATVPPPARAVTVRRRVSIPPTIAGDAYRISVEGRSLVLEHPDPAVGGRARLALPDRVRRVTGRWQSGGDPVVRVRGTESGVRVVLRS